MTLARPLRLMGLFAKVSIQNVAAYRFDLFIRLFVSAMHLVADLIGVWTIFHNTQVVAGWRWQHMIVLVGVFRIVAGAIRMSIVPNMRRVLEDIMDGTLDFVLMRPINAQFFVSIREFVVWRIVDVVLGVALAAYGCIQLHGFMPMRAMALFVVTLTAGMVIVYSIWLGLATLCFWFVRIQNIEMVFWNVFEAGRFPIHVYPPWVQWTLTYLIPVAFITTFPAAAWTGDPTKMAPTVVFVAVGMAAAMFGLASWFWRVGLRHYSGASA
jgi:ABC-2 type transport system permease protein